MVNSVQRLHTTFKKEFNGIKKRPVVETKGLTAYLKKLLLLVIFMVYPTKSWYLIYRPPAQQWLRLHCLYLQKVQMLDR